MTAIVVCPHCGSANQYHPAAPDLCATCRAPLPESARLTAGRALARRRPLLLTLAAAFLSFFAGVGLLVTSISTLGDGPYRIDGEPATKGEFLQVTLPMVPVIVVAGVIAYGLRRERAWARPLLFTFYLVAGLGGAAMPLWLDVAAGPVIPGLVFTSVIVGFLGWYLYRKRNVVAYYRALAD